jgi:predicted  nucleic acid-binding Zn-ribbon protein
MSFIRCSYSLALLLAVTCSSCSDDPKLVEKREKQKAEITRLKGELALITEKLKNLPPDVTDELADARALAEKQSIEVSGLETEVAGLEAKKRSLQSDFDAYQLKYVAK